MARVQQLSPHLAGTQIADAAIVRTLLRNKLGGLSRSSTVFSVSVSSKPLAELGPYIFLSVRTRVFPCFRLIPILVAVRSIQARFTHGSLLICVHVNIPLGQYRMIPILCKPTRSRWRWMVGGHIAVRRLTLPSSLHAPPAGRAHDKSGAPGPI